MANTPTSSQHRADPLAARSLSPADFFGALCPAVLALLAAFCTGANQEWAFALFVAGLGFFVMSRLQFPRLVLLASIFLALFWLWPLLSFSPANWWGIPAWRTNLNADLNLNVGSLLTPQPLLSWEQWFFLSIGVLWFYFLSTFSWSREQRSLAIKTYCVGITLLACLSLACNYFSWRFSFWDPSATFGPFANRNQTSNLFALAGILILACDYQDAANKQRWTLLWFLCLGITTAALVQTFSRAGIVLFFGGATVWTIWLMIAARSAARLSLAITLILLLLSLFFIFGGKTLERFTHASSDKTNQGSLRRWQIQQDAFNMSQKSPYVGYGIGNFGELFAFYRQKSATQDRVIHPENDYLWLVIEEGWPALFFLACLAASLLPRWRNLRQHSDYPLRAGCLTAAAVFALHGIVDVSGHRFGTIIPAIFLLSLSFGAPVPTRPSKKFTFHFNHFIGASVAIAGLVWFCSAVIQQPLLPSSKARLFQTRAEDAARTGQYSAAAQLTDQAAKITPLNWRLYFQRAQINLSSSPPLIDQAALNFRRARFLEPYASSIAMAEALRWLPVKPPFALAAWKEAIDRAAPEKIFDVMSEIITKSSAYPNLRSGVKSIAESRPDLNLIYWQRCTGEEFSIDLRDRLQAGETFFTYSPEQKRQLFDLWVRSGDLGLLEAAITAHPEWQKFAWRGLAKEAANRGDYERAWRFVEQFAPNPNVPSNLDSKDPSKVNQQFLLQPDNPANALALYQLQMRRGLKDDALQTLRQALAYPAIPPFFLYLQARLLGDMQKWREAWECWEKYEANNRK